MKRGDAPQGLKILCLAQHYWPEIAATAQVLSDLCEDLAKEGHSVTVICGQPSYRKQAGESQKPTFEHHAGVNIKRVWSYIPARRTMARRLFHYISYFFSALFAALRTDKPDVVLVLSTPPLLLGVAGTCLKWMRGIPFVYSVQDLYPDIAVHLGVIKKDGLLAKLIKVISDYLYRQAAHVVTLSQGMETRLLERGVLTSKLSVIPNWADTDNVRPNVRDGEFTKSLGFDSGFIVQYSGNVGLSQDLETLVEAASLVERAGVQIMIVGDGNARASLEDLAKSRKAKNIAFVDPQPRARLSETLSACDVGFIAMKKGVSHDLVPSKLYGILAVGRPVLAAVESDSEVARTVERHGVGVVVEPEDPARLAEAILSLQRKTPEELSTMGKQSRELAVSTYSRATCTKRYAEVMKQLMLSKA